MLKERLIISLLIALSLIGCSPDVDYPEEPLYRFFDNFDRGRATTQSKSKTFAEEGYGFKTDVRNAICCPVPGKMEFNLTVPRQAVLAFAIGISPESKVKAGKDVTFRISLKPRGSSAVELFSKELGSADGEEKWLDEKLDLSRFGDMEAAVIFETEFPRSYKGAESGNKVIAMWGNPVMYTSSPALRGLNVILISIDTLRPDHLKCYGYEKNTSPNIDRLAAEGVLFVNAIAQCSWTLPSHISMMTSLYPSQHGVLTLSNKLSRSTSTLAELLRDNAYNTAAFTGGGYVSSQFGFYQGFNSYFQPAGKPAEWDKNPLEKALKLHDSNAVNYKLERGYDASVPFDRAREWIKKNHDRKFFVFLHTYETHPPYVANEFTREFVADYDGPIGKVLSEDALDKLRATFETPDYKTYMEGPGENDFRYLVAMYDGHIKRMDAHMGKLMNELTDLNLHKNTLVIFTSDHGEEFMEHGKLIQHGNTLYDEQVRVPLIMECPGEFSDGKEVIQQVSLNDIMPTVLDLTGTAIPSGLMGKSLKSCLEGAEPQAVNIMSETQAGKLVAIRSQEHKFIHSPIFRRDEFYDLAKDSPEAHNLARTEEKVVEEFKYSVTRYIDNYFDGYFILCIAGDIPSRFKIRATSDGRFTEALSTHKTFSQDWLATKPVKRVEFEEAVGPRGEVLVYLNAHPLDAQMTLDIAVNGSRDPRSVHLGKSKKPAGTQPLKLDPRERSIVGRPGLEEGQPGCFIWRNQTRQDVAAEKAGQEITTIDSELRQRLKALGYLD